MNTQKISLRVHFLKVCKNLGVVSAVFLLISCTDSKGEKMLHMSNYDVNKGEKPEFMLRGYEDYKIKFSSENVRVENKISLDDIASIFTFEE